MRYILEPALLNDADSRLIVEFCLSRARAHGHNGAEVLDIITAHADADSTVMWAKD